VLLKLQLLQVAVARYSPVANTSIIAVSGGINVHDPLPGVTLYSHFQITVPLHPVTDALNMYLLHVFVITETPSQFGTGLAMISPRELTVKV
jgi:hypothetical protein